MSIKNMNTGDGETSYANNSGLQKVVISKTWPVLDKTIKDMFAAEKDFPKCMKMVDLGCSSGPNTLFVISHIMEELSKHKNAPQELEVFLNDLPANDFNNLFKQLPNFSQKNNKKIKCFMYGAPGSFYGRLFPSNSLDFVHSSYSVHWLSQIPGGLEKENKENIYIARTSPPQVFEAYSKQYQKDFSRFLKLRGEEIRSGGRMVLTFLARSVADPFSKDDFAQYRLLAETLSVMVAVGIVKEDDLHSFNVPIYGPCVQEIEAATSAEGSFSLDKMEAFRVPWDATEEDYENMVFDKNKSGKFVADCVRAFIEPMLVAHFGSSIIDGVFDIYAKKMAEHLSVERSLYFNLVISLTRK